jgi:hypothetical protein
MVLMHTRGDVQVWCSSLIRNLHLKMLFGIQRFLVVKFACGLQLAWTHVLAYTVLVVKSVPARHVQFLHSHASRV